jgi:hypothetical protein
VEEYFIYWNKSIGRVRRNCWRFTRLDNARPGIADVRKLEAEVQEGSYVVAMSDVNLGEA